MTKRKRIGFTIGVMLLMGGLGLTWYAYEQQQAYPTSVTESGTLGGIRARYPRSEWLNDGVIPEVDSRVFYVVGIVLMTVGAGITAFHLPLPEGWK